MCCNPTKCITGTLMNAKYQRYLALNSWRTPTSNATCRPPLFWLQQGNRVVWILRLYLPLSVDGWSMNFMLEFASYRRCIDSAKKIYFLWMYLYHSPISIEGAIQKLISLGNAGTNTEHTDVAFPSYVRPFNAHGAAIPAWIFIKDGHQGVK